MLTGKVFTFRGDHRYRFTTAKMQPFTYRIALKGTPR